MPNRQFDAADRIFPAVFVPAGCVKRYNILMRGLLIYAGFLLVWFFVLPRIPGLSRFT